MISSEKFFGNFFEERAITSIRLANFSSDVLNRLIATNTDGSNTALISTLTPAVNNLKAELGGTDTALSLQKGKTLSVDTFIEEFREAISNYEGVITYALGGTKTPAYLEFFPYGLKEYSRATKSQLPLLLNRLKMAAAKYAAKLDANMAKQLQEFESTWQAIRDEQVQQKASLSDNRTDRQDARKELETILVSTMHTIALRYPCNVEESSRYFDFNLLYGQSRKGKKEEEKKMADVA